MRRSLALVLVPASLVLLATATSVSGAAKTVTVGDDFFVRPSGVPTVTVRTGTTVRWRFTGQKPHNVTASGPARFSSRTMKSGTYSKRVTRRGTYRIICTIHGASDQSMKLRVR